DDEGILLAARTEWTYNTGMLWVVKLNRSGKLLWDRVYDHHGMTEVSENVMVARASNDGGYLLGGYLADRDYKLPDRGWLLKLKANGTPSWSALNPRDSAFHALVERNDGSIVITGDERDALLLGEIDASGMPFSGTFRRYPTQYANGGRQMTRTDDGGFLISGGIVTSGGTYGWRQRDVLALKLDNGLQSLWQAAYGVPDYDESYALLPTDDGGALLSGKLCVAPTSGGRCLGLQPPWWLRINAAGEVTGQQILQDTSYWPVTALARTSDGGYASVGSRYLDRRTQLSLIKTESLGTLIDDEKLVCLPVRTPPEVGPKPIEFSPESATPEWTSRPGNSVTTFSTGAFSMVTDLSPSAFLTAIEVCDE
ncbi:MAG: hypothetical protein GY801_11040, partial [bacterium]|nr:hypothetical protein [bacterium]